MKPSEAKKWLKEKNIKFILAQFVDIHGAAKSKAVPAGHYDDLVGAGAGFAGFAMWGFGMGPEGPDYMAVGEPGRICELPWMPGYARMVCDGHVHGKPYSFDSRVVLETPVGKIEEAQLDALHRHRAGIFSVEEK